MSHAIRIDESKNRFYLTLSGLFSDAEVHEVVEHVIAELKKMKPGFTILTDISQFRPLTQQGVHEAQRVGDVVRQVGGKASARVVAASASVAAIQLGRVNEAGGYRAFTCRTVEEAERLLDELGS